MKTLLAIFLAGASGGLLAQTPAANPMPDGSSDMYVGLGVASVPDYPGARGRRVAALPLIQMAWSSGVFVAGMSAGMHMSQQPSLEFGPLLSLHAGRDQDGTRTRAGGVDEAAASSLDLHKQGPTFDSMAKHAGLKGMDKVSARLQGGGFLNVYLSPTVRVTNSVLYGAGNGRDGLIWNLGVQRVAAQLGAGHRVSVGAGLNLANRSYNATYFGVQLHESVAAGLALYVPGAGLKDVYVGGGWNWALSPRWMVASSARITRLMGDARHSPLVERATSATVTSGIAYRF